MVNCNWGATMQGDSTKRKTIYFSVDHAFPTYFQFGNSYRLNKTDDERKWLAAKNPINKNKYASNDTKNTHTQNHWHPTENVTIIFLLLVSHRIYCDCFLKRIWMASKNCCLYAATHNVGQFEWQRESHCLFSLHGIFGEHVNCLLFCVKPNQIGIKIFKHSSTTTTNATPSEHWEQQQLQ